jgi:hypothetical protein
MADIDKVIEAQKYIDTIADDLKRMGSAAQMLNNSREEVSALIESSKAIIENAGSFTTTSGEILKRLNTVDVDNRLKNVEERIDNISISLTGLLSTVQHEVTVGNEENQQSSKSLLESIILASDNLKKLQILVLEIKNQLEKDNKTIIGNIVKLEKVIRELNDGTMRTILKNRTITFGGFVFVLILLIGILIKILI